MIPRNAITLSRIKGLSPSASVNYFLPLMVGVRGLPLGYVNKLEARLAETEAALFHILKQKHGGDSEPSLSYIPPALRSSISTGRNKTERLKEWERLPLRSMSEVHSWYCFKAAEGCRGATPPMTNSSSASQVPAVHETETLWGPDTRPGDRLELALAGAAPTTGVAIESPESNASRAKELSQSQPHLYF